MVVTRDRKALLRGTSDNAPHGLTMKTVLIMASTHFAPGDGESGDRALSATRNTQIGDVVEGRHRLLGLPVVVLPKKIAVDIRIDMYSKCFVPEDLTK